MPPPAAGLTSRFIVGPALRTQPDRRLVALVREGYETAFDEIVRRYGKPLGRYAASIVGGRSEDVTQDAFSKALVALRRDQAEIELRPWLYRIVRNTALNDLRDRPPTPEVLAEAIVGGRDTTEEVERRQEITDLVTRLRALPDPQRAAIVMRELEGLSHDEIAASLGMSGGAVRQAIYRARQVLRDGAGLLLPLPLLRVLLDHGAEMAAGAGAGASGAAIATGASAGGAGAGGALKVGALVAVLAGSVGTGIALQEPRSARNPADAAAEVSQGTTASDSPSLLISPPPEAASHSSESNEDGRGANGRHQGGEGQRGQGGPDDQPRIEGNEHAGGGQTGRGGEGGHPPGLAPGPDRHHQGGREGGRGGPHSPERPPDQPVGDVHQGPGPGDPEGGHHRGSGSGGGERTGDTSGPGGNEPPEGMPALTEPPPPPPEEANALGPRGGSGGPGSGRDGAGDGSL